jgi:glycosyltransferase involved in cell wall biosynthesis
MLLDSLLAGGAERIAVEVACALDRDRFEPSVVAVRHTGALEDTLVASGVHYTILGRQGRLMPPNILRRGRRLLESADLVQANKFEGSMWGALWARRTGVPLVTRDPMWTGSRTRTRTLGYRRWIGPVARRIVTPSSIVATSIIEEGVDPAKLVVIPNGVPLNASLDRGAARGELGLGPHEFVVGIIARLREQKRHDVLLRAMGQLRTDDRRPRLCVVGTGEEEARLRALAATLDLDDTVVWAGERKDARRLARAFDVAVICSWWEGLPVAALELLAAGTPLVATPVGALPEVLEGGVGVFVDVGDSQGLAAAIAKLMDDPDRRSELATLGRQRIRDRYSLEAMVASFERLYEDVLSETVARAP